MANKYIDADRLKAEIEGIRWFPQISSGYNDGREDMKMMVFDIIDSLQQEQPENEEKIMNFFDALGDCGFSQHDILLLKNIWKEAGCPLPKSQVADASKMEQSEVDLEKEIDDWYNTTGIPVTADALKETARHFYELGLNARKEK